MAMGRRVVAPGDLLKKRRDVVPDEPHLRIEAGALAECTALATFNDYYRLPGALNGLGLAEFL